MLATTAAQTEANDPIISEYEEKLRVIERFTAEVEFWDMVMGESDKDHYVIRKNGAVIVDGKDGKPGKLGYWQALIATMEQEADEKAAEWRRRSYDPKQYPGDRALVLGTDEALRRIRDYVDGRRQILTSAIKRRATIESEYPAIIYGYRNQHTATVQDVPTAAPEATVEEMRGVLFNIRIKPLGDEKAEKKWRRNMEKAGYVRGEDSPEGWWNYTAPVTTESEAVFTAALKEYDDHKDSGDGLIVAVWEDYPAQTEIPVDLELSDAGRPWRITTVLLDDDHDHELIGQLKDSGFVCITPLNEGEWTWEAPDCGAARDLAESAFIREEIGQGKRVVEVVRA